MNHILNTTINAKQIERLCHDVGQKLENIELKEAVSDPIKTDKNFPKDAPVYCMADGSMVLTRENDSKWKELKLGRIFSQASNITNISKERGIITDSIYSGHFGTAQKFWEKFSKEIPPNRKLVFIADGAKWLWNYIESHYPNSVQILDLFHCKEHVYDFASEVYGNNKGEIEKFVSSVFECFINSKVSKGIKLIADIEVKTKTLTNKKQKLLTYLIGNEKRINYGAFKKQGYLIGSGAIEAAHRNVIQKRLKLSGQRWTIKGAQQVANIRICEKSYQWNKIVNLICPKAA